MLASELIQVLQEMIEKHGDRPVVSGVARSGYGEPVVSVADEDEDMIDTRRLSCPVFDLVCSEESLVAKGGW